MNLDPNMRSEAPQNDHPAVAATLRALTAVEPDPQMKERLLRQIRLASADARPVSLFFWRPRVAAATFAGCLACTVIVAGSIEHSRHAAAHGIAPAAPVIQVYPGQSTGVGTAAATHIAAHPQIAPQGGGRTHHRTMPGRANLAPGTHSRGGVSVPVPQQ
jgi:negative regulator of sigma E activity